VSFRPTKWAYLARCEPQKARQQILAAYRKTGGNAVRAAGELEISHRQLTRLVDQLALAPDVQKVREQAGNAWAHREDAGDVQEDERPAPRAAKTAKSWLEQLKAGDVVVVDFGEHGRATGRVDRVTATKILVGNRKFDRTDGRLIGAEDPSPHLVRPARGDAAKSPKRSRAAKT
jgi:hypothetical protein